MNSLRILASLFICRFPSRLRSKLLNILFGWDVHPTARIGLSLLGVRYLSIGSGASIGHGNVIRDIKELQLGNNSVIGQWNWISASVLLVSHFGENAGCVRIGPHSAITSRHYIDASGGFSIGDYSILAGVKSTILTHQIDLVAASQTVKSVTIGDYCFIGSDCRIVAGSNIHSHIVLAMGAVVTRDLDEPYLIYGGVPAKPIKNIESANYFTRDVGWVGPASPESIREITK